MSDLERQFGQIDIYLFDQLLRGRIRPGMRDAQFDAMVREMGMTTWVVRKDL